MVFHTIVEINQVCFNWCKEQNFVHQRNLEIQDLGMVAVALVSLLINHMIYNHSEFIIEKTEITEDQLEKLHKATSYFAFILLIIFLGYQIIKI